MGNESPARILPATSILIDLPGAKSAGPEAFLGLHERRRERRSPGVYSILWQIGLTRKLGLSHLYLGYWINNCRKMAYKTNYFPLEAFIEGTWRLFEPQTAPKELV
jgi:Arginine-tRNA-protein transferase, C terminus